MTATSSAYKSPEDPRGSVDVEQAVDPNVDQQPRCRECDLLFAEYLGRPWKIRCRRCKAVNKRERVDHPSQSTGTV